MFLDVGNVLRMARLLFTYPSYYAGNLAIMKLVLLTLQLWNLLYSYLYVPQRYIAVSTNLLFGSPFG